MAVALLLLICHHRCLPSLVEFAQLLLSSHPLLCASPPPRLRSPPSLPAAALCIPMLPPLSARCCPLHPRAATPVRLSASPDLRALFIATNAELMEMTVLRDALTALVREG